MSWALARLRTLTGDELLVRAGDNLVPTPRAVEMREKVRELVQKAHVLLRPSDGSTYPCWNAASRCAPATAFPRGSVRR